MSQRLTPTDVASHLACPHRTQLERQRRDGSLAVAFMPDARLEAMLIRGKEFETTYVKTLIGSSKQVVDLSATKDSADTILAMRSGADLVIQAPLGNDVFFGVADLLLRVDSPSSLGDFSYQPVDTKLAVETKAGALLQLLTYCELLHEMQGVTPDYFHVVTPLGQESYRTIDYSAYFRVIRERLRSAHSENPPPPTYPDPVSHCEICAYWNFCEQRRRSDDDPSLIAKIQHAQVQELKSQGLTTLAALAEAGAIPTPPKRGRPDTYARLAHQARLQRETRSTGVVAVERLPIESGRGLFRLPVPTPGDVFLDFEGDPFIGQGGLEYLTGYCVRGDNEQLVYEQLWALDRESEKQALETFLDFVAAKRQEFPELHIYHFGAYEVSALRRLCSRYDTRAAILDELLRGERFINLHTLICEGFRIGIESYGLKELEKMIGYPREFDLRSAGEARRDLELHLELGRRDQIDGPLRDRVAAYNRDDCLATAHLRDWLETKRSESIADGHSIDRPTLRTPEAGPAIRDKEARIEALRASLTQNLPPPDARNDEQRALALLADLVGYFMRERKSAWWEHFRLREVPADERLGEREILADLQFVGIRPKEGKERNIRCAYDFPSQETALDEGDDVFLLRDGDAVSQGVGTKVGKVASIDLNSGQVIIKQSSATGSLRPRAVFREQVVNNDVLESGLLAFADHVRDNGLQSRGVFAAASDLLLRRPPALVTAGAASRLKTPDETPLDAVVRICEGMTGSVLPIQGPPGSGKSFTGGHAIAALVRAGKKIGVTAVSHKVIDNLLIEVRDAAAEIGSPVRLVHKHNQEAPHGIEYTSDNDVALNSMQCGAVVGGTAWLWAREDAASQVDFLFVDEAGQMSLAQVLSFARAAKNLVLLGDPQQLEQPHKGTHPEGADIAALTHLIGTDRATLDDDQGLFLGETWRLHPSICDFTSELYYEGRLHPIDGCARQRIDGTGIIDGAGLYLLEVDHEGNQAKSQEEIDSIHALVRHLLASGASWTNRKGEAQPLQPQDVLIVAPYNAQVSALRRALSPLGATRVGTVDKFQGQEAPIVIYSCTSSSPTDAPRGLGFLYDPHRLNVATSRARCSFVMVASSALFMAEVRTPEQMHWVNGMCRFREMASPLLPH